MKKLLIGVGIAALSLSFVAPIASAGDRASSREGGACVKAGLATLRSLDALPLAAKGLVDYEPFDNDANGAGLINTDLPSPAYLPLSVVIKLHQTNPALFDWVRVIL